jgi:hypothetical protein
MRLIADDLLHLPDEPAGVGATRMPHLSKRLVKSLLTLALDLRPDFKWFPAFRV